MMKLLTVLLFIYISLHLQAADNSTTVPKSESSKIVKEDGLEVYVDTEEVKEVEQSTDEENTWTVTEDYNLSGESGFYLDAALVDYSELTDCEEDAKEIMADEALANVDLCPTRNIDIRLAHPIEIKNIHVTSRKLTKDECQLEATYTLSTLPPEEMAEIEAVCQDEYDGYGASLMLQDGLWQGLQLSFGVGYSQGDVADMEFNGVVAPYRYIGAPMMTTDAAYMYKLPVANLYALAGGELGWVMQQANTLPAPQYDADGVGEDGGSPYIFRIGLNAGLGYRFHMRYDIQAQMGYQFQYLYRTVSTGETFTGYENNVVFGLRGAYHFHENFAVYLKVQTNTSAANGTFGVTYEFWD